MCFCQPPHLFQPPRLLTLEIFPNLPFYCTLPVYYFGQNLPASPSIWNSRIIVKQWMIVYCFRIEMIVIYFWSYGQNRKFSSKHDADVIKDEANISVISMNFFLDRTTEISHCFVCCDCFVLIFCSLCFLNVNIKCHREWNEINCIDYKKIRINSLHLMTEDFINY